MQAVVRSERLEAYGGRDFGQFLEFQDFGVLAFFQYLFAVFHFEGVLLQAKAVLRGEAIAGFRAFTASIYHCRHHLVADKGTEFVIRFNSCAARGDRD